MCVFHLTNDHEESTCPKNVRYQQLEVEKVATSNVIIEEEPSEEHGDFVSYCLEYESDFDRGSDILLTLEEASCSVLTHGQRVAKVDIHTKNNATPTQVKELKAKRENEGKSSPLQIATPLILKRSDYDSTFDIVEFCKTSRIQISPYKYLRMNP